MDFRKFQQLFFRLNNFYSPTLTSPPGKNLHLNNHWEFESFSCLTNLRNIARHNKKGANYAHFGKYLMPLKFI